MQEREGATTHLELLARFAKYTLVLNKFGVSLIFSK